MKATAKEKWTALLKSLWTPTVYMLLQLVTSFLIILPLTVSALSTMMKESNPLQFDFGAHVYKLYSSPAIVNAAMVLTALSGILMTVYMVFYYRKKKKITYPSLGISDLKPKSAIFGSLLGIGSMTTIVLVLNLIYQNFDLGVTDSTSEMISMASPLWAMVATVAVAPVVEEFIFRGFMFERLSRVFSPRMTIFLTALAFGLVHMNLIQSSYAFLVGLVFGYFRAKYEDLWGCILFHIFANFFGSFDFSCFGEFVPIVVYLCGMLLFIVMMIIVLCDKEKGMLKKKETEKVIIIEETNG
ncbi:MAG: CPBP family intramembrane metalloprotease [Clostridia bacterium]|nr:CPBP family intramembrane metalloprotease [Clostridia bacterium]